VLRTPVVPDTQYWIRLDNLKELYPWCPMKKIKLGCFIIVLASNFHFCIIIKKKVSLLFVHSLLYSKSRKEEGAVNTHFLNDSTRNRLREFCWFKRRAGSN
jgi:hypothetical protein